MDEGLHRPDLLNMETAFHYLQRMYVTEEFSFLLKSGSFCSDFSSDSLRHVCSAGRPTCVEVTQQSPGVLQVNTYLDENWAKFENKHLKPAKI